MAWDFRGQFASACRTITWLLALTACACVLEAQERQQELKRLSAQQFISQAAETVPLKDLAQRVAGVATDREIFKATPSTVVERLQGVVEVRPENPTKYIWQFRGANPEAGVQWAQVDFQAEEAGKTDKWIFLQIRLGLTSPSGDLRGLYEALRSEIAKRLGKKGTGTAETGDHRRAWRVGRFGEVSIREGEFENPTDKRTERLVLTEIAILQGEAER
jgi:hypothetical protein